MKKLILFLLIIAGFSSSAFADSKPTLVYDKASGDVIAIGYFTPEEDPMRGVEYLKSDIPKDRIEFYKRTSKGVIELKSKAEKDAILEREKPITKEGFQEIFQSLSTDAEKIEFLAKAVAHLSAGHKEEFFK